MRVLRFAHHAVVSAWRERERELRRRGVDVALVAPRVWNEGGRNVRLDVGGDRFVRSARTVGRHPSVFLYSPRAVWRAIGRRPDLIDLHEEPNSLAVAEVLLIRWLRRSHAPYLVYSAQNIRKRYPQPFRLVERIALRGAAAAYVCNADAGRILEAKGLRAGATEIPLGVDLGVFAPAERARLRRTVPVIGYAGRLEPHKGVDVLLRAVALRPAWELRLTGDGPERSALERLADELGIADRVRFLGFASEDALAARYRELDAIAVPSLDTPSWREQFCRVAVEAMASGVPVVGSDSGAIPDVLGDAGIVVPQGDPAALAAGLDLALARSEELRAAGLARVPRFSWSEVADEQAALYRRAIGAPDDIRPDPEVLVVAYGPPEQLDACLDALGPASALGVTVVDNSSLPATAEVARRHGARYIDAGRNRGFAGGVNLGLAALADAGLGGRDVLLLNPDARIGAPDARGLHRVLHSAPRIAAVGATQTEPGTGAEVRVWWPFPTPAGAVLEAVGLGALRRRRDFAIGSILLLNADAVAELGGLDERYFLYAEETDWQRRARDAGWGIRVARVAATHEGGGTGGDPIRRETHFTASHELYLRRHHGRLGWAVYRAASLLGALVRGRLLPGERGAAARRRARLFARGPVRALRELDAASRPLRIVHVVCTDAFAGVERWVQRAALGMRAAGAAVTVIGGDPDRMGGPLREPGVRWLPGATPAAAARALLASGPADVIVTHMTEADLVGAAVGRLRRTPVVSVRHFAAPRGSGPAARSLSRLAARGITRQIAVSEFVARSIDGASVVVPSGVPVVPDGTADREPIVLVLQRLEPEKATDVALRAWAAAGPPPGWRLVVAGEGGQQPALRALAGNLGLGASVEFAGFQREVGPWLDRASLLLAPAPAEPFGLSVVEAMAHGLPVVAADGGAHPETVGGAQGAALFPPGDATAAAAELTRLIGDPAGRDRYGSALRARQRAEFDVDASVAAVLGVLEDVAHPPTTGLRLVIVSLEPWDEVWRRNQHLADGLLSADPRTRILFVEPPADPVHALRIGAAPRAGTGLRAAPGYGGRLHLLQPTKALPRALGPAADRMLDASVRSATRRLGWVSGVRWLNDPRAAGLAGDPAWPVLYDITDDWVAAQRAPREHARLAQADALLVATAAEVVVCSPGLLASRGPARPAGLPPVRLVPNAVDRERYRRPHPRPADLPDGRVALYAGTLHEDRLDTDVLLRTADAVAASGARVVLLGPDATSDATRRRLAAHPGLLLLGARPADAVPAYLQHADVLLVPHLVDAFTDSLDPIKLYEYLAAGRPVVATPVAGFRDDPRIRVASTESFPAVVAETLDGAGTDRTPGTLDGVPDWSDRVADVDGILRGLAG